MVRSDLVGSVLAAAIGGLLGFIALWLREMGWAFAAATTVVLVAFYVSRNRIASIGWLLLAGGGVPALILARNGLEAILDRSIEVGVDTWVMLSVAVTIAAAGALTLYVVATRTHPQRDQQ